MPQVAAEQQSQATASSWRVAIIDDVYAGPTKISVSQGLAQFCAEVSADDGLVQQLTVLTKCDFSDPEKVSDDAIGSLHKGRDTLASISAPLTELFRSFDQRHAEVTTIEGYLRLRGCTLETFDSVRGLFDGEAFELVFLDLRLARGDQEAQEIAKQIYDHFKAFILLMSNIPGVGNAAQAEEFRRKTRLIRGLFDFCPKDKLCDEEWFRSRMDTLPRDPNVCRAVYDFVMSIDKALGGPIDEPNPEEEAVTGSPAQSGRSLGQFIHTLRTLGLQDYALLCELTLRDEGHPLGDYMMRLLGSHLIAKLLADTQVRSAVGQLDRMRFTEFLPFGDTTSASFNQMYADSLTEGITEPWTAHPWSSTTKTLPDEPSETAESPPAATEAEPVQPIIHELSTAAGADIESVSEILQLLGLKDDGRELPFLQLGDLLIKDDHSLVYGILSASCDLQFTPEAVSVSRPRKRDDTVLLLPGRLRSVPPFSKARATTGLIHWNNNWYCIDWLEGKLLGVPHCVVRMLLEDNAYEHKRRLQIARALELQHTVLSWVSRIGLDVQPPFPMESAISIFGRNPDDSYSQLGDVFPQGALVFHGRVQPALVLRESAFYDIASRMRAHSEAVRPALGTNRKAATGIAQAIEAFRKKMIGMKLPIILPEDTGIKSVKLMDGSQKGYTVAHIGLRVGNFDEPPSPQQKEFGFCLTAQILTAP